MECLERLLETMKKLLKSSNPLEASLLDPAHYKGLFVEGGPWSTPHRSTKEWWKKLLKDFNNASNVLEVHPKFLMLMTAPIAKTKVEKELDLFEAQDADAGQQSFNNF